MELQKIDSYSKAYVEILEIINHMEENYRKMIPSKLIDFFEENKDLNYSYNLGEIKEDKKVFSKETISLLVMLESKYLAKDNDKKVLNKALIKNEEKYQEELRKKYNPDNIFKKPETAVNTNKIVSNENTENTSSKNIVASETVGNAGEMGTNSLPIEKEKESFFDKIINFFKGIFKK